jgi:hypothetical protein
MASTSASVAVPAATRRPRGIFVSGRDCGGGCAFGCGRGQEAPVGLYDRQGDVGDRAVEFSRRQVPATLGHAGQRSRAAPVEHGLAHHDAGAERIGLSRRIQPSHVEVRGRELPGVQQGAKGEDGLCAVLPVLRQVHMGQPCRPRFGGLRVSLIHGRAGLPHGCVAGGGLLDSRTERQHVLGGGRCDGAGDDGEHKEEGRAHASGHPPRDADSRKR